MAAPRFSTFRPVHRERPRRWFTLQDANRSLPLVTRIVRDIVNTHGRAMQLQAKLEATPMPKDTRILQEQLERAIERLQDYIHELDDIGVELKDYETGLIDFPGRHEGRDIYLCWKMGEDQVEYWHELHTGFAGRQSVRELQDKP
ncbi:MAG TPA: DUF2203 domain-containing protein [Tepidisphaeraceae bacterium]|nr:DUF2203 domain-containing protein [Tepidisphaeraceae bacterium]